MPSSPTLLPVTIGTRQKAPREAQRNQARLRGSKQGSEEPDEASPLGRRLATTIILENCTEGWHRDAKNPLPIYLEKSPSKRMLDLNTIPKGDDIPFMDQVPALAIFEAKEQCYVTMVIGNQQEKEYHDCQHDKPNEFDVPVRFVRDGRSLHAESKAPQE
ncbi:hypothetical protein FJTKL_10450 [Diaporthe vaccinii]|uniref:Uncharacterized protein n=1 Tax=Diaporthe vaccinii TaxID=105482 RepID=A0ABR4EJH5_9PEZI